MNKNALTKIIRKLVVKEMMEQARLNEFREDLMKQCVVLMGLPAAGKSTFINNEIQKYIPNFKGYKVANSDKQVLAAQYETAKRDYNWLLKNITDKKDIEIFVSNTSYVDNNGKPVKHPLTYEWWQENRDKGLKYYYKNFYKPYYATYFDIRNMAKGHESQLFVTKVKQAGNILVIDTVGASVEKIYERMKIAKDNGFVNTVVYLEIDPELCVQRDKWRQEHEGRGVGVSVIEAYAKRMNKSFDFYCQEGHKKDGVVDRMMHFVWEPTGNSPIKGTWKRIMDKKYFLKRKLGKK